MGALARSPFSWARSGAIAALLVLCGCGNEGEPGGQASEGRAPEWVATNVSGEVVRLADYRGKVLLVNFWQAGCGPCLAEMTEFEDFYKNNRDKGVEIVAINMGQSEDAIGKTAKGLGLSFPLLADPLKITSSRYDVIGTPTSFVIDPQGRMVERIDGPLDREGLKARLAPG